MFSFPRILMVLGLMTLLPACEKDSSQVTNRRSAASQAEKDLTGKKPKTSDDVAGKTAKDQPTKPVTPITPVPEQEDIPQSHLSWDGRSFQGNDILSLMSVE